MAQQHQMKPSVEAVETADPEGFRQETAPVEHPWKAIRSHPKVILYALLANIGPLMFGYDFVIVGSVSALPKFR